MHEPNLRSIYDDIGPEKIEELVNAFYPKVYSEPLLIPIFDGDMSEIMYKQRLFLTQFTGGPPLFSEEYDAPMMKRRHLPFQITPKRANAWLRCMKEAFLEIGLDKEEKGKFFFERLQEVASIMVNTDDAEVHGE